MNNNNNNKKQTEGSFLKPPGNPPRYGLNFSRDSSAIEMIGGHFLGCHPYIESITTLSDIVE